MKDLIKNYKKIIRGQSKSKSDSESDHGLSDAEGQPLLSSTNSGGSSKSFGAVFKVSETESETEMNQKSGRKFSPVIPTNSPKDSPISNFRRNISYCPESPPPDYQKDTSFEGKSLPLQFIRNIGYSTKKSKELMENNNKNDQETKDAKPTNPSIITIFAIWNTMLGSSLLAVSWGIERTGLVPGIIINLIIAAICLYMAYLLLKINEKHNVSDERCEVPDLCRLLIGKWAEILAKIISLVVLIGADIVYWILMSNFLFNLVKTLQGYFTEVEFPDNSTVICSAEPFINLSQIASNLEPPTAEILIKELTFFDKYWDLHSTVPIILGLLVFPVLNFKDATVFLKFNSVGTASVIYLMLFVVIKAYSWGINLSEIPNQASNIFEIKPTFVALSGMLSLSYFIHNIIITIMKNNRHQENNGRDLTIGFGLVTFTYTFIGGIFYISFPLAKLCIEDNFFNNFDNYDTLVVFGRLLLMFQLFTVFPLLTYMLRHDINAILKVFLTKSNMDEYSYWKVLSLNLIVVVVCILFACFLPKIGTIIRYTGALSGMVYVFMLPNFLKICSLKKENKLTLPKLVFHVFIVILGVANLLSQFLISD